MRAQRPATPRKRKEVIEMPVKWTKPKKERAQRPATPESKPKGGAPKGESKPKKRAGTPATPGKKEAK